jgi:small conductance mechanosensitive channel
VQRAQTLKHILRHLTTVAVSLAALIHSLTVLGWDVKPLLAGAGILGVALGFGAQTLVRDWIAGVFILIENQFAVGDVIEVNGRPGTVEALTVRSTTLRDFNGYLHFVPNGEMKIVTNRSRGWNRLAVDVALRAGQDLDRALECCREVADAMNADPAWKTRLLEPVHVWGIERLGADAVVIRLVVRARPGGDVAEAARELRRRVHHALARAGVQYPSAPPALAVSDADRP